MPAPLPKRVVLGTAGDGPIHLMRKRRPFSLTGIFSLLTPRVGGAFLWSQSAAVPIAARGRGTYRLCRDRERSNTRQRGSA